LIFNYNIAFIQLWSAKIGPHFTHWSAVVVRKFLVRILPMPVSRGACPNADRRNADQWKLPT